MPNLSQRLQDGLIGEDEHAGSRLYKPIRNEFRAQQRNKLRDTIATIEADLKGLLSDKHTFDCNYWKRPGDKAHGYCNCNVADITAAIEHYTRDKA